MKMPNSILIYTLYNLIDFRRIASSVNHQAVASQQYRVIPSYSSFQKPYHPTRCCS